MFPIGRIPDDRPIVHPVSIYRMGGQTGLPDSTVAFEQASYTAFATASQMGRPSQVEPGSYHRHQVGSPLAISDSNGSSVRSYAYDPYGNLTSSSGSIANPFQFQGQFLEATSGLYYLRARFYDPVAGQFLSRDAMGAATRASYAYASDSPLNATDATGRFAAAAPLFGGAAAFGLADLFPAIAVVGAAVAVAAGVSHPQPKPEHPALSLNLGRGRPRPATGGRARTARRPRQS